MVVNARSATPITSAMSTPIHARIAAKNTTATRYSASLIRIASMLTTLALLAGCAGSQAMQWKPPPKMKCPIRVCDVRWPDKPCDCVQRLPL